MFQVSSSGQSVRTATGPSSLLNDNRPLTKLDTQNLVSFQTISILFNHEPANVNNSTFVADTLIYQFAHGYNYIPAIWMGWQSPAPTHPAAPPSGGSATTFLQFGDDTASGSGTLLGTATQLSLYANLAYNDPVNGVVNITSSFLYCYADTTNVYIYIRKVANTADSSGNVHPIFVIGTSVNIRFDVFTEPATTSTY